MFLLARIVGTSFCILSIGHVVNSYIIKGPQISLSLKYFINIFILGLGVSLGALVFLVNMGLIFAYRNLEDEHGKTDSDRDP